MESAHQKPLIRSYALASVHKIICLIVLCGTGWFETFADQAPDRVALEPAPSKVLPPEPVLVFPPTPTPQDFFRARVFEEPLVPIGGEPGADENAALAAGLLGYARRSGPDDF